MTDCGCDKAKAELEEYLHRELSEPDFEDVRDHLDACVDCSEEAFVGLTLTQKVQRACRETAPEELAPPEADTSAALADSEATANMTTSVTPITSPIAMREARSG